MSWLCAMFWYVRDKQNHTVEGERKSKEVLVCACYVDWSITFDINLCVSAVLYQTSLSDTKLILDSRVSNA